MVRDIPPRMCSVCGSPEGKAEAHTYDADGKCTACTFEPLAKDEAGDLYGRTQDHSDVSLDVNDALAEGHTITLWRPDTIASKTIQGIYIDFDAAGKSATLDMNGYSLETSKGAPITVENGTLTVTGDATLVQNGTQELASSAVRVTGGTLIFDGKLTATGRKRASPLSKSPTAHCGSKRAMCSTAASPWRAAPPMRMSTPCWAKTSPLRKWVQLPPSSRAMLRPSPGT